MLARAYLLMLTPLKDVMYKSGRVRSKKEEKRLYELLSEFQKTIAKRKVVKQLYREPTTRESKSVRIFPRMKEFREGEAKQSTPLF